MSGPGVRVRSRLLRLDGVALPAAFPQTHAQRDHHEFDVFVGLGMPGNDPLRGDVDDERDVDQASPGAHTGDAHHPGVIGSRGGEVTVQQVAGADLVLGRDRGAQALVAPNARESDRAHSPVGGASGRVGHAPRRINAVVFRRPYRPSGVNTRRCCPLLSTVAHAAKRTTSSTCASVTFLAATEPRRWAR